MNVNEIFRIASQQLENTCRTTPLEYTFFALVMRPSVLRFLISNINVSRIILVLNGPTLLASCFQPGAVKITDVGVEVLTALSTKIAVR
jgi:hypothetical protein